MILENRREIIEQEKPQTKQTPRRIGLLMPAVS
jgi:hypothetical protein